MEIETRIEHLTDEIAEVKTEVRQVMLEMRRLAGKIDASSNVSRHSGSATAIPTYKKGQTEIAASTSWIDKSSRGHEALKTPGTVKWSSKSSGGLNLSEQDLALVSAKLKLGLSDADRTHNGGFSLDELARTIKEVKTASRNGIQGYDDETKPTTVSLEALAQVLRKSSGSISKGMSGRKKRVFQSRGSYPIHHNRTIGDNPKVSSDSFDKTLGDEVGLDVNLMTNLMRWVGSVKLKLGVRGLQSLLELYGLTGHLTLAVENAIARIARLDVLPDESNNHIFTVDDLIDAYLQLHSINYGSGGIPVARVNDCDRSEMWAWVSSSKIKSKSDMSQGDLSKTSGKASAYDFSKLLKTPEVGTNTPNFEGKASGNVLKPEGLPREMDEKESQDLISKTLDSHKESTEQLDNVDFVDSPYGGRDESGLDNSVFPEESDTIRTREAYLSDVTDAEWFQLESLIPAVKPGGRPGKYDRREIVNGILYHERTGCSWRKLPEDLPPWRIVYHYYREWSVDGTWTVVIESLAAHRRRSDSRLRQDRLTGWLDVKSKGHNS